MTLRQRTSSLECGHAIVVTACIEEVMGAAENLRYYIARLAQNSQDAALSEARRGIDEREKSSVLKLQTIKDGL